MTKNCFYRNIIIYLYNKLIPFMADAIHLKSVPKDVLKFVLKIQGETKSEKCIKQYSMEQTIYKLIREHKEFTEKKNQ